MVLHDGTNAKYTEYAVLESSTPLGDFSADLVGGNVRLLATMASNTTATLVVHKTMIAV
jgi:hypothetical protein